MKNIISFLGSVFNTALWQSRHTILQIISLLNVVVMVISFMDYHIFQSIVMMVCLVFVIRLTVLIRIIDEKNRKSGLEGPNSIIGS